MAATRVALDANILVLLAFGSVDKDSLGKRRRVREFLPRDYDVATRIISHFQQAVVTPNVVTECSDLLSDCADEREKQWLKAFLQTGGGIRVEEYVPSRDAAGLRQYEYLGIADCSLLSLVDERTVLLTTDAKLADAATRINPNCMNFNHWRDFT